MIGGTNEAFYNFLHKYIFDINVGKGGSEWHFDKHIYISWPNVKFQHHMFNVPSFDSLFFCSS